MEKKKNMTRTCKWWMVRAAQNGVYIDDFVEKGMVSIGGNSEGALNTLVSKKEMFVKIQEIHSDWKKGKQIMWASQLYRFAHEIVQGDRVVSYDTQQRIYHVGTVTGGYGFQPQVIGNHPHYRTVSWHGSVSRDCLSISTKNSLGAICSLFFIPVAAAAEIETILKGEQKEQSSLAMTSDAETLIELEEAKIMASAQDAESKALEYIKDKVNCLDWEDLQELVAGILRAMGYKTQISPTGPDRGKDIIASPDGLGFENPRIIVEVKHREKSPMSSQAIRSFLGGRHPGDKGLYVSTGGFSKDAYYEAERANIPLTLMNFDDLVKALVCNYEALDIETKQLIPLRKIFWPV
jgi:restriction system protein